MNKNLLLSLALIFSIAVFSDGHSSAEKMVLENVEAYWEARNVRDWDTVVALTSSGGMLGTNSDGSFHKPLNNQTAEDWESQTPTVGVWLVCMPLKLINLILLQSMQGIMQKA